MHICFSDYNSLFPHIEALDDCYELQLEFSNRDSRELGTKAEDRPGYDVLERFAGSAWEGKIGLGVIDIHTNLSSHPSSCATAYSTPRACSARSASRLTLTAASVPALGRSPEETKAHGRRHPAC